MMRRTKESKRSPEHEDFRAQGERLLGCTEAAAYVGVSVPTLRHWRRRGLVPHVRVSGSIYRYRASDLDRFLAARTIEPNAD
jgi:excisionase family DNA binding protein